MKRTRNEPLVIVVQRSQVASQCLHFRSARTLALRHLETEFMNTTKRSPIHTEIFRIGQWTFGNKFFNDRVHA